MIWVHRYNQYVLFFILNKFLFCTKSSQKQQFKVIPILHTVETSIQQIQHFRCYERSHSVQLTPCLASVFFCFCCCHFFDDFFFFPFPFFFFFVPFFFSSTLVSCQYCSPISSSKLRSGISGDVMV